MNSIIHLSKGVLLLFLLLSGTMTGYGQVSYCFQSSDGNKFNLKFTLIDKEWKYGYIKYNEPEYAIFIRQKYDRPVNSLNEPGLREYMWEEVRNDSVTGTYQFMKQGDEISNVVYKRALDKKEFRFSTVKAGIRDCECDW
jgi:hypothetical protein